MVGVAWTCCLKYFQGLVLCYAVHNALIIVSAKVIVLRNYFDQFPKRPDDNYATYSIQRHTCRHILGKIQIKSGIAGLFSFYYYVCTHMYALWCLYAPWILRCLVTMYVWITPSKNSTQDSIQTCFISYINTMSFYCNPQQCICSQ